MARTERLLITVLFLVLGFFAFNFNQTLGVSFVIFLTAYAILNRFDKRVSFPFIKSGNDYTKSFIIALFTYIIFIFSTQLLNNFLKFIPGQVNFQSTIQYLSSQVLAGQALAFEQNAFFIFLAFALVIPFVETLFFFGTLMETFVDYFNVPSGLSVGAIPAIGIISSLFTLFHVTARIGAGSTGQLTSALATVFLFAVVSCILVLLTRQTLEAILFHVIANSTAVFVKFSITTNIILTILLGGAIAFGLLQIVKRLKFGGYLNATS